MSRQTVQTHLSPAALDRVLQAAVRAPSSHNSQPWLFALEPGYVELLADRTRALSVTDPDDRELTISCGAALFNLLLAARHEGAGAVAELLPEPDDPDVLARVRLHDGGPRPGEDALFAAIEHRHTYRGSFEDDLLPLDLEALLRKDAEAEGAWFEPLAAGRQRDNYAMLVAEADRMQWADRRWRRELASWMHPRRRGDGLPVAAPIAPITRAVVSFADLGVSRGTHDLVHTDAAPFAVAIGTMGNRPSDWLVTGQALERVLLRAASLGLQAGFANQPLQLPELRFDAADVIGHPGIPQVVVLLGRPAEQGPISTRRPLDEVIVPA